MNGAIGALNSANANGMTPTGFVAGMTPEELATFRSMIGSRFRLGLG